jgi:hypothetical protein
VPSSTSMIHPDLDFALPAGRLPEADPVCGAPLPEQALQWRSLYWARRGVPPPSPKSDADFPRTAFHFPDEAAS